MNAVPDIHFLFIAIVQKVKVGKDGKKGKGVEERGLRYNILDMKRMIY